MTSGKNPVSRQDNIVEQDLNGEVLVYDLTLHKAYCLNETSASVWKLSNGVNSVQDISRQLSKKYKSDFSEEMVFLALEQLKNEDLIVNPSTVEVPKRLKGLNRREVIRKIGLGSLIALPVVAALVSPTAANAQSAAAAFAPGSRTFSQTCNTSTDCAVSAPRCNSFNGTSRCCTSASGGAPNGTVISTIPNSVGNCGNSAAAVAARNSACTTNSGSGCCSGTATNSSCTAATLTCTCS